MKELSDKQKRFCEEYLVDCNATAAHKRAGYVSRRHDAAGWRLLHDERIAKYIAIQQERLREATRVTQEQVVKELACIAFSNAVDFTKMGEQGLQAADMQTLTPEKRAAIAEISDSGKGLKIKTYDKVRALEMLGRHLGIFSKAQAEAAEGLVVIEDGVEE